MLGLTGGPGWPGLPESPYKRIDTVDRDGSFVKILRNFKNILPEFLCAQLVQAVPDKVTKTVNSHCK